MPDNKNQNMNQNQDKDKAKKQQPQPMKQGGQKDIEREGVGNQNFDKGNDLEDEAGEITQKSPRQGGQTPPQTEQE